MAEPHIPIATAARPRLTLDEFDRWLTHAASGDRLEYHRGFLALDRCAGSRLGATGSRELDRVAKAAMTAADAGRAHLVQRRHGDGDYSYLLVARPRPAPFARSRKTQEARS